MKEGNFALNARLRKIFAKKCNEIQKKTEQFQLIFSSNWVRNKKYKMYLISKNRFTCL